MAKIFVIYGIISKPNGWIVASMEEEDFNDLGKHVVPIDGLKWIDADDELKYKVYLDYVEINRNQDISDNRLLNAILNELPASFKFIEM